MKHLSSLAVLALVATAAACASSPPAPPATPAVTTTSAEPATVGCELVCEGVEVVPEAARAADSPDHHAAAVADANRVIASMHDDLLACYKKRLAENPRAHGFVTLDIVIEETGRVRKIESTGGALLGAATMRCMTTRVERATFAPVHGGGTLRLQIPLTLRTVSPGESI